MKSLQNGLQVIIQTEKESGGFLCEGFLGIPVVNPSYIAITTDKSRTALDFAQQLKKELILSIRQISIAAKSRIPPCNGRILSLESCHAHGVNVCNKLLLVISDGNTIISKQKDFNLWLKGHPNYHVLPIFPEGSNVNSLLPKPLQKFNCTFWSKSIYEAIPTILSISGLTSTEFKIFISYRRFDTTYISLVCKQGLRICSNIKDVRTKNK